MSEHAPITGPDALAAFVTATGDGIAQLADTAVAQRATIATLLARIETERTARINDRQAAALAIDALTEQLNELERRVGGVHSEALRALTSYHAPKGA